MFFNQYTKNFGRSLLLAPSHIIASFFKTSFMVGSKFAFFSAVNCVMPLSGIFAGYTGIFFITMTRLLFLIFCSSTMIMVNTIPSFIASIYATTNSKIMQCLISVICMMLFLLHPEGSMAKLYTLYWIIPIVVSLFFNQYLYLRFLGTTFTAHAVGSVLFLYQTNMSSLYWNGLIPVVIFERLLFTAGMIITYHIFNKIFHMVEQSIDVKTLKQMSHKV